MGEKMIPCPAGHLHSILKMVPKGWKAGCSECGWHCTTPHRKDTIALWNTRHLATPAQKVDIEFVREGIAVLRERSGSAWLNVLADKLSQAIRDKT
jgi:hypothetical protein